jgi:hypothetical protein
MSLHNNNMGEKCSFYRIVSNSKGSTVFNSINSPVDNEYGDYVFWNNTKSRWEVGTINVIIGQNQGKSNPSTQIISIGRFSGHDNQSQYSVAIGNEAGYENHPQSSVAIGRNASQHSVNNPAIQNTTAFGTNAGQYEQQPSAIAFGADAGQYFQSQESIAMGVNAGNTGQQPFSIAIGANAGYTGQQTFAVAIGTNAGANYQPSDTIAIGTNAGHQTQHESSIIMNASGQTGLNTYTTGLFVAPVRGPIGTGSMLSYNTSTKEVVFNGSSQRYKHDIQPLQNINTENIYKLEPKTFKYKESGEQDVGLIAEEANKCDPLFAYKDGEKIPEGIQWTAVNTYLIQEMKNLKTRRDKIRKDIEIMKIKLGKPGPPR